MKNLKRDALALVTCFGMAVAVYAAIDSAGGPRWACAAAGGIVFHVWCAAYWLLAKLTLPSAS